MTKSETIIAVKNIKKSSEWYQTLLGCNSAHAGDIFEILKNENQDVILCLHKWGDHEHPSMKSPTDLAGNGLILFFRVDDLSVCLKNAKKLNANIQQEVHYNANSLKNQFTLRDLDGYYLIISE